MFISKKFNFIIFSIIIFFVVLKFFNTPYNIYSIINWNYEKRMQQNYGLCKNESWGFYNLVNKKFNLKNKDIRIINDEGHVIVNNLFEIKNSKNSNSKYLMILNYQDENEEINDLNKYNSKKKYKIIYKKNNCFLLKLND